MSLLTEKSRLILRTWAFELRHWWRSRRWVRRRLIRKYGRQFIPMNGADDRVLKYAGKPGVVIRADNPHTFPVMVVPSLRQMQYEQRERDRQAMIAAMERVRYTQEEPLGGRTVTTSRGVTAKNPPTSGPETDFERRYLEAMRRPPA